MKVLIAATPLTGHVNPLLAIGRLLAARGDDVIVTTDPAFAANVVDSGLGFEPSSSRCRSRRPGCGS